VLTDGAIDISLTNALDSSSISSRMQGSSHWTRVTGVSFYTSHDNPFDS